MPKNGIRNLNRPHTAKPRLLTEPKAWKHTYVDMELSNKQPRLERVFKALTKEASATMFAEWAEFEEMRPDGRRFKSIKVDEVGLHPSADSMAALTGKLSVGTGLSVQVQA